MQGAHYALRHPNARVVGIDVSEASLAHESELKRSHALDVNHACARCHQVLFTQYPWTWEGENRKSGHPGGAHINSGEARDLLHGQRHRARHGMISLLALVGAGVSATLLLTLVFGADETPAHAQVKADAPSRPATE